MSLAIKISGFFVSIALANIAHGYPWPFDHATNTQQVVRQTVGAFRAANRLHTGLDIQPLPGISDSVYCVEEGTVLAVDVIDNWVRIGAIAYVHVVPDTSMHVDSTVVTGQLIGVLEALGTSADHVHFVDGPAGDTQKNNPLLSIASFSDTLKPIVDSLSFFTQLTEEPLPDTLWGRVDIAVAGRETIYPMGTDEGLMPYKLGFKVYKDNNDSLVLDKFEDTGEGPTIRFNQVMSHSGYGRTIHRSEVGAHPEYWITNTSLDGALPRNRFWNTRADSGQNWDAELANSADRNLRTRWPDGKYRVQALLGDTQNNTNELGGSSADTVLIDNFPPYVHELKVFEVHPGPDTAGRS